MQPASVFISILSSLAPLFAWMAIGPTTAAAGPQIRMTIIAEWGKGGEQPWQGKVTVQNATLVAAEGHLMDPDERGVFGVSTTGFEVDSLTRGVSDGARFTVRGPLSAVVRMEIGPEPVEFTLGQLVDEEKVFTFPHTRAQIAVRRDPLDRLQVRPEADELVLGPGEPLRLRVLANPITADGKDVEASLRLDVSGRQLGAASKTIRQGEPEPWEVTVPAPRAEGVYTLKVSASGPGLDGAERPLEFVVIDPAMRIDRPQRPQRKLVDEIDCTDPGDDHPFLRDSATRVEDLPLGRFRVTSTKGRAASNRTDVHDHMGWFAYRLRVANPGACHVLNVEYPDDCWQTVGVSVFEPDAVGRLVPVQLDSGYHGGGEHRTSGKPAVHALIFWPRTKEPIVLVTNRQEGSRAAVSRIRLYEVPAGLPALAVRTPQAGPQRLLGIYYEEPKLVENFGGPETASDGQSLPDWNTFYQAGRHLVDYLKFTGMNAVLLQSYGYQSTLYPTTLAGHLHRYDPWNRFADGRDPFQKDLLEMLLSLFDRDGLVLVPSVNFEQAIPELEALRKPDAQGIAEIDMVANNGSIPAGKSNAARGGMAPLYDPLHPAVQEAMLKTVTELARRYAGHASLGGVSIQHRGLAFVQYPGLDCGYGDYAVGLFAKETGRHVPGEPGDPDRFMKRYIWLTQNARDEWIRWRCEKLHALMLRLRDAVRSARADLVLYVSYMNSFQSIQVNDDALPWYESGRSLHELLRVKGLDPMLYMDDEGIVVTRPVRQGPMSRAIARNGQRGYLARDLTLSDEVNGLYTSGPHTGVLTFHEYFESRLRDFDDVCWMPSRTWLVGTIPPEGRNNLERYASWMAGLDPAAIFDGGWQAPMGREAQMREFAQQYRALPAVEFVKSDVMIEPAVCRTHPAPEKLLFYLVNQAPYAARVAVHLDGPAEIRWLATGSTAGSGSVVTELPPFALQSFETSAPARIVSAEVNIPDAERQRLEEAVRRLRAKENELRKALAEAARAKPLWRCDFAEMAPGGLPDTWRAVPAEAGWEVAPGSDGSKRCLEVHSDGQRAALNAPRFDSQELPDMRVRAVLRGTPGMRARLYLTGKVAGRFWSRYVEVPFADASERKRVVLPIIGLDREDRGDLSARVDIMSQGTLWVDTIEVLPGSLDNERAQSILRVIHDAKDAWSQKHYARLERLLDSYWGRAAQ